MFRFVPTRAGWIALSLACMLVSGCNRGEKLAPVHGRVTYAGKPVNTPGSKIMFFPEHGRPSAGLIAEDGTYTLTFLTPGDGALVGEHKVTVWSTTVGPGSMGDMPMSVEEEIALAKKGGPKTKILVAGKVDFKVPKKYSRRDSTPLTATVENKDNEINFEIPAGN